LPTDGARLSALDSFHLARSEYERGEAAEDEAARPHFERAVELYPFHADALDRLAWRMVADARAVSESAVTTARGQAVLLLERALRIDPTAFSINVRMGWNCGHLGRFEETRVYIARATRHRPMATKTVVNTARAYADWRFLDEAERFFRIAISNAPDVPWIVRRYAAAVWDLGAHGLEETSRALALIHRALAATPDDARCHVLLAKALATFPGATAQALHHADRALSLDAATKRRLRSPHCCARR
jgi:tetratricopeptide (TPR) repeat protein